MTENRTIVFAVVLNELLSSMVQTTLHQLESATQRLSSSSSLNELSIFKQINESTEDDQNNES